MGARKAKGRKSEITLEELADEGSLAAALTCEECSTLFPLDARTACDRCFGPLSVVYGHGPLRGTSPDEVLAGRAPGLWRYLELLPPVSPASRERVPLGPSPLRPAPRLARALGLRELWLKEDLALPSGSFKDRPAGFAVAYARDLGYPAVGCASTGNLAAATARAATLSGLPAWTFVPAGLPEAKLLPVRIFGGGIVEVEGTYDDANRVAQVLADEDRLGLVNINLRPYYVEASKTLAFEILEERHWHPPAVWGIPLGSGALLSATFRALMQVQDIGWLDSSEEELPRLVGSQPEGCAPIAEAFRKGSEEIVPVAHPETIAESLAIGNPASGYDALGAIRKTGGAADAPTADEVRWALREAARLEGVWSEPAGGTVLATFKRLVDQGTLDRSDSAVAFLTGAGWKTPPVWEGQDLGPRLRVSARERSLTLPDLAAFPSLAGAAAHGEV